MHSEVELEHQTRRKRSRCIKILDFFRSILDVSVTFFVFLGGSWGLLGVSWGALGRGFRGSGVSLVSLGLPGPIFDRKN